MDPFQYTTIASACMASYRAKFMEEDTIGMIPVHGYVNNINSSKSAIEWLDFISHKEGISIQHSGNGYGEKVINRISVDGFCEQTNTVFQFQGKLENHIFFSLFSCYFSFMYLGNFFSFRMFFPWVLSVLS